MHNLKLLFGGLLGFLQTIVKNKYLINWIEGTVNTWWNIINIIIGKL